MCLNWNTDQDAWWNVNRKVLFELFCFFDVKEKEHKYTLFAWSISSSYIGIKRIIHRFPVNWFPFARNWNKKSNLIRGKASRELNTKMLESCTKHNCECYSFCGCCNYFIALSIYIPDILRSERGWRVLIAWSFIHFSYSCPDLK